MSLILVAVLVADPPAIKVGQPAPTVVALFADGNPYDASDVNGKFVLMTWRAADDEATRKHFANLRAIRKEFLGERRLQMISIKHGGTWEEWLEFQGNQPPHDPKHPMRPFYSDAKWWQAFHSPAQDSLRNPFRVGRSPQSFLIAPDGKLLAVNVPDDKLLGAIKEHLPRR